MNVKEIVLNDLRNVFKLTSALLLILILGSSLASAQQKTNSPVVTVKAKAISNDTLKLNSGDTLQMKFSTVPPESKVTFIKEESKSDLLDDILPVFCVLLGIAIEKLLEGLKDRKAIRKTGERWVAEIRGLKEPVTQQIKQLEKLLETDGADQYTHPELTVMSTLDCEIFKSMDKSQLLKFIERKSKVTWDFLNCGKDEKTKKYNEVIRVSNNAHGLVNVLSNLHTSLRKKFEDYLAGTSQHVATVNVGLQSLSQAFAKYGVALETEHGDPIDHPNYRPILDLFNKYIEPHREDGAFDLFLLQKEFFFPLITFLAQLRHDNRIDEMSSYTAQCINGIKGLKMEKRYWRENVRLIATRYTEQLADLNNIADKIENRKPNN